MHVLSGHLTRLLEALCFDPRTIRYLKLDLKRLMARLRNHRSKPKTWPTTKLHLGSGSNQVSGWLNCDIEGSDLNIDIAKPPLPFSDCSFTQIVAQHLIEHLEYDPTLLDLLADARRILKPGGHIWLSCPDLEAVCRAYVQDKGQNIDEGRKRHWPHAYLEGFPVQHRINFIFHQWGEHRNLYDFEMIDWALRFAGFAEICRTTEEAFLAAHPAFRARENEETSLIVRAIRP